jgi:molybdate transport system substrate-binding protein
MRNQARPLILLLLLAGGAAAESLKVFAAASLTESFKEIGALFAAQAKATPAFQFAATNELRLQIENGAKADVFASASLDEMERAVKSGIVKEHRPFVKNRLVLIVPKNTGKLKTLRDLSKPGLKLVIAGPKVPVGAYTLEMLDKMAADKGYGPAYKDAVLKNVASHELNVKAVCAKVSLGEGDAGVVYYSDVTARLGTTVQALDIPARFNVDATYPVAVLASAPNSAVAKQFVDFLVTPAAQAVFKKYNFGLVAPGK